MTGLSATGLPLRLRLPVEPVTHGVPDQPHRPSQFHRYRTQPTRLPLPMPTTAPPPLPQPLQFLRCLWPQLRLRKLRELPATMRSYAKVVLPHSRPPAGPVTHGVPGQPQRPSRFHRYRAQPIRLRSQTPTTVLRLPRKPLRWPTCPWHLFP